MERITFLFDDHSRTPGSLACENLLLWSVIFLPCTMVLYLWRWWPEHKFQPAYPPRRFMALEAARSIRGVLVCTLLDWLVNWGYDAGIVPALVAGDLARWQPTLWAIPLLYLWGDLHFYVTHRLLHWPWLYKRVHKIHHESINPDPLSGLSMHPMESLVYFSAAALAALVAPRWMFRLNKLGLLIFPVFGHSGFLDWHHYLHHTLYTGNFGSSPLWDYLAGTRIQEKRRCDYSAPTEDQD